MKKEKRTFDLYQLSGITGPLAGHELLRHIALPDLLGQDANKILYYMGKNLARKFPLNILDELPYYFKQVGWGDLKLVKEKKTLYSYELTGPIIEVRKNYEQPINYRLECGFIAEQIRLITGKQTEATYELKNRNHSVIFEVLLES